MANFLLQEENALSANDLLVKVKKLDGYIKKIERRMTAHEKALQKFRQSQRPDAKVIKGKVVA